MLAADVAGYTRLMEVDEGATLAAWWAARKDVIDPTIAEHGGRIVKLTGDGFLAEFATATEAVTCAVAMQTVLVATHGDTPEDRRFAFRMGVNLGEIVDDEEDIYGDGVNIAARIESMAEPGGIWISANVYEQVHKRLDIPFLDMGEQTMKNVSAPVQTFRVVLDGQASKDTSSEADAPAHLTLADKPSIAVLPFQNMSGDPEQEYFSDGLTEDIITLLSAWRSFPVVARNTTFAYKGQASDIRQVAEDLGARYVLEGSVRKAGNRVRISAQLIDGQTGNHLWADRYDRELEDVFAVQDEITANIVAAVEPEMSKAEMLAVTWKRPENLNSWELYLRGLANMPSYGQHREETKRLFEQAIDADPIFVDAYTALALCYSANIYALHASDADETTTTMFDLARKAIAIDPRNFRVHQVLCMAYFWQGDYEKATQSGRKAVELNPSSADAFEALAAALNHLGSPEEAERCARMCLNLNPLEPDLYKYNFQLMQAKLGQRDFEAAYKFLQLCINARPHDVSYLGFKTVLLGHMERSDEARACLDAYLSRRNIKTAEDYRKIFLRNSALVELNLEGLRKAGWDI